MPKNAEKLRKGIAGIVSMSELFFVIFTDTERFIFHVILTVGSSINP